MITTAQAIVNFVTRNGIRHIFGKIDDYNSPLIDTIARDGNIKFISSHREETAILMADGYARTRRGPGIAVISGNSASVQAIPAFTHAACDGSPLVLLSINEHRGCSVHEREIPTFALKDQWYANFTGGCIKVDSAENVMQALEEAFHNSVGRTGPAYISIPSDFLTQPVTDMIGCDRFMLPLDLPAGNSSLIRQASELLMKSENPAILLGGGTVWSGAGNEAMDLAEFLFAPVATSSGKSGIVSDQHPLYIGKLGDSNNIETLSALAEADVIIILGCALNWNTTSVFAQGLLRSDVILIQVDIDPNQIGKNYPVFLGIAGDARRIARDILQSLKETGAKKWPPRAILRMQQIWERREMWNTDWRRLSRSSVAPIRRSRLIEDIIEEIGPNGLFFGEVEWKTSTRGSNFAIIQSFEFPIAGAHLPLGLGASLALSDRPVVAVLAAEQAMSVVSELSTAVEYYIPVLVVVLRAGGHSPSARSDHQLPSLADIASSMGAYTEKLTTPAEIRPAVRRAIESRGPCLIEAVVGGTMRNLKPGANSISSALRAVA